MMKKVCRIAALALSMSMVLALFAGCDSKSTSQGSGGTKEKQADKSEKVSMRICSFFTGADQWAPAWKEAVEQFLKQNPNVKIEDESTPAAQDAIRTKVKADIASNMEPDVVYYFSGKDAQILVDSGKMFAWDEELKKDTEWGKNFKPDVLEKVKNDGKQYGLPYIGFYEGLFWNKDLFDKFNLEAPSTYENFLKAVDTFAENNIIPLAASVNNSPFVLEAFILSQVGPEGTRNHFDKSWAPALYRIKELYEKNAYPKDALTLKDEDARVLFADQKAAMMINGSWAAQAVSHLPNVMITTLPKVPDGKIGSEAIVTGYGSAFFMSDRHNKEKNGVPMKFVKFMTSPEIMGKFIARGGSAAINCDAPKDASKLVQSAAEMFSKAKHFLMPIDSQVSNEAFFKLRDDMGYVVIGKKTPEQLLEEARKIHEKTKQ